MLSYTPVTDLVRHTDDPARAEYLRSLRGSEHSAPGSCAPQSNAAPAAAST